MPFHVFYLLAERLMWGVWDAYDLFYIANTRRWTSTTTMIQVLTHTTLTIYPEHSGSGIDPENGGRNGSGNVALGCAVELSTLRFGTRRTNVPSSRDRLHQSTVV